MYVVAIGLFIYFLGFIMSPKESAESEALRIVKAVNDAVLTRRDNLLTQSLSRKVLLARQYEIQQQVFRQQAAGSGVAFSVPAAHTTPSQTGTIATPAPIVGQPTPAQVVIPTPTYVKPRTTVS